MDGGRRGAPVAGAPLGARPAPPPAAPPSPPPRAPARPPRRAAPRRAPAMRPRARRSLFPPSWSNDREETLRCPGATTLRCSSDRFASPRAPAAVGARVHPHFGRCSLLHPPFRRGNGGGGARLRRLPAASRSLLAGARRPRARPTPPPPAAGSQRPTLPPRPAPPRGVTARCPAPGRAGRAVTRRR